MIAKLVGLATGVSTQAWLYIGLAIGVLALVAGIWTAGYNYRDATCDAAALRLRVEQLNRTIVEKDRQLAAVSAIQLNDAKRAATEKGRADGLQKRLDDTPVAQPSKPDADGSCSGLDRPARERVRNYR